jgi:hypothetical protein
VAESYPSYTVSVDLEVTESPFSAQVYGIARTDLDNYVEGLKVAPATGGWLPADASPSLVDQGKEYLFPFR